MPTYESPLSYSTQRNVCRTTLEMSGRTSMTPKHVFSRRIFRRSCFDTRIRIDTSAMSDKGPTVHTKSLCRCPTRPNKHEKGTNSTISRARKLSESRNFPYGCGSIAPSRSRWFLLTRTMICIVMIRAVILALSCRIRSSFCA